MEVIPNADPQGLRLQERGQRGHGNTSLPPSTGKNQLPTSGTTHLQSLLHGPRSQASVSLTRTCRLGPSGLWFLLLGGTIHRCPQ